MVFVCSYTDVSENGDNDVGLTSFTESLYLWADSKRRPTLKNSASECTNMPFRDLKKKLGYRRETARRFANSLKIIQDHSKWHCWVGHV